MHAWSDLPESLIAGYGITNDQVAAISDGYPGGLWKPYQTVTRAQFTKMAALAFEIDLASPATPSFSDVPETSIYYEYIEGAKAVGMVNGTTPGLFGPEETISRQQALAITARYIAGVGGQDLSTTYTPAEIDYLLAGFGDAGEYLRGALWARLPSQSILGSPRAICPEAWHRRPLCPVFRALRCRSGLQLRFLRFLISGLAVLCRRVHDLSKRMRIWLIRAHWRTLTSRNYSGGSLRYASGVGDAVTITFTGSALTWIAKTGPTYGKAEVTVDSAPRVVVDLYSSRTFCQQVVYTTGALAYKTHTVRIVPSAQVTWGWKTSYTSYINLDAVDVTDTPPVSPTSPGTTTTPQSTSTTLTTTTTTAASTTTTTLPPVTTTAPRTTATVPPMTTTTAASTTTTTLPPVTTTTTVPVGTRRT